MAVWKCKFCGAPLEVPESGAVASCEYCGVKQTVPKLDDERRNLLLDRAGQFLRSNEYDRAAALYEQAINEGGDDPELFWSLVLCRYGIEYVEDAATHRRIPTVNRTQFSAVSADPDYREAVSRADTSQREIYEREAAEIDAIQRGILEISQKEEPFDVFICYKESDANGRRTPDSVLAQELYYGLKNEGFKVFFSRISLEDKLGTAYEPYIFSALHSAKAMVVIGTKPEYFNAPWVKNEWSRYLALIKQGEKKVLIPAYRDMDPYNLPDEFAALQAQDMGKLGFMQDLVRGIKKIIGRSAPKSERTTAPATPAVAVPIDPSSKDNLLERGFLSLEYKEWKTADSIFEQVLNVDLHEARAYVGKLLAIRKLSTIDALAETTEPIDDDKNFKMALRFADDEYRKELESAVDKIKHNISRERYDYADSIELNNLSNLYEAAKVFRSLDNYRDSAQRADDCELEAERIEKDLQDAANKKIRNTFILKIYSIASMIISLLLVPLLPPTTIQNSWLLFPAVVLIGGIVFCCVFYEKSRIGIIAVLPAALLILPTASAASSAENNTNNFSGYLVLSTICFAILLLVVRSRVRVWGIHYVVPKKIRVISSGQYANSSFVTVTLHKNIQSIKSGAFANCTNLSMILFNSTQEVWKSIDVASDWISGMDHFCVQCTDGKIIYSKSN